MKITNRQLRQIIREELAREAKAAIPVRTVSPEDYDPPAHLGAEGPRASEVPQARVGNFFMRAASVGMPTRGYSSLKKQKIFYMILPDGEAIRVGDFSGDPSSKITSAKDAKRYLAALDAGVTILPVSDFDNPTPADLENMRAMADDIEKVAQAFRLNEGINMKITKSQLRQIIRENYEQLSWDDATTAYDIWRDEEDVWADPEAVSLVKWMSSRRRSSGKKYVPLAARFAEHLGVRKSDFLRAAREYGSKQLQLDLEKYLTDYRLSAAWRGL